MFASPLKLSSITAFLLALTLTARAETNSEVALTNAPVLTATNSAVDTNAEVLRSLTVLEEQLRTARQEFQLARQEAEAAARHSSEILSARLNLLEQTITVQRQQDLDRLQSWNKLVLIVITVIAAIGFFAIVFVGWIQMRSVSRFSEMAKQFQMAPALPPAGGYHELPSTAPLNGRETAPPGNATLLATIDRLQQRVDDLEHTAAAPIVPAAPAMEKPRRELPVTDGTPVTTLIAKGQTLLNLDKPGEALACFEEVLSIDGRNVEAWIKKGTALERLQRTDEAIEAYDHAIAADGSTATAYLFKAGVFNRLKRYSEALQCYEKALSVQKSRGVPAAV